MIKIFLHLFVIVVLFQVSACAKENDPKKAFDSGDDETAYTLWLPLAEDGDTKAQNYLGIIYYLGLGTSKDDKKAVVWYERTTKAGYADTQRNFADMVHFDRGTEKDIQQAYKWYFAASQQGNEKAERQIAVIAASGNLSPNQQMHAKIDVNEFILDETKHVMCHDT